MCVDSTSTVWELCASTNSNYIYVGNGIFLLTKSFYSNAWYPKPAYAHLLLIMATPIAISHTLTLMCRVRWPCWNENQI